MKTVRITLILCGTFIAGWGVVGLIGGQSPDELLWVPVWLGGAIVAHDGLLAPVVIALGALGWRLMRPLPRPVRNVVATGALVAGILALLALPTLIRYPVVSNPTALPQSYGRNLVWIELAVLGATVIAVLATLLHRRRRTRSRRPATHG